MDFRGIIANAVIMSNGRCQATLVSPDNNAGEQGRRTITQGGLIDTSPVISIDVIEGQLIIKTMNSQYLIEGEIKLSSTLKFTGHTSESYILKLYDELEKTFPSKRSDEAGEEDAK